MDPIVTMIVDLLRKRKETEALNRGGEVVDPRKTPLLPVAVEPKHGGKTYDEIIDSYGTGR